MRKFFEALRHWATLRQDLNAKAAHRAGFDWAAGELLRGTPARAVEERILFADGSHDFDLGAYDAVKRWQLLATARLSR